MRNEKEIQERLELIDVELNRPMLKLDPLLFSMLSDVRKVYEWVLSGQEKKEATFEGSFELKAGETEKGQKEFDAVCNYLINGKVSSAPKEEPCYICDPLRPYGLKECHHSGFFAPKEMPKVFNNSIGPVIEIGSAPKEKCGKSCKWAEDNIGNCTQHKNHSGHCSPFVQYGGEELRLEDIEKLMKAVSREEKPMIEFMGQKYRLNLIEETGEPVFSLEEIAKIIEKIQNIAEYYSSAKHPLRKEIEVFSNFIVEGGDYGGSYTIVPWAKLFREKPDLVLKIWKEELGKE